MPDLLTLTSLAALASGYLLGSIPFGLLLTRARRPGRRARDRLGQHRRHQRAAHRQQGARGRHAAARRAEGRCRRPPGRVSRRSQCGSGRRPRRLPRPRVSRSGSASRAARASPPISACCSVSLGRLPSLSSAIWLAMAAILRAIPRLRRWPRAWPPRLILLAIGMRAEAILFAGAQPDPLVHAIAPISAAFVAGAEPKSARSG